MVAERTSERPGYRRLTAAERAARSGFSAKLRAWLAAHRQARDAGAVSHGPCSPERLAKVVAALGEPVTPATVYRWCGGAVLPESRYVPIIERLLGAPFSYLDDPGTTWPRPVTREALLDLLALLPDAEFEHVAQHLRARHERGRGRGVVGVRLGALTDMTGTPETARSESGHTDEANGYLMSSAPHPTQER
ncbi:MAG: hypothetical protein R3F05_02080 [Planctomycetota bacterium]